MKHNLNMFFLLFIIVALIVFYGCMSQEEAPLSEEDIPPVGDASISFDDEYSGEDQAVLALLNTGLKGNAKEKNIINEDAVGWLRIPNTKIDDVVMFYPDDANEYYLRRNFDKRYSWEGSYFADYRCTFDGTRQGLSRVTTIYGHSMDDNPDGSMFSQLKKYLDADFAKENPYIFFSTTEEDMAWEIFAVYYATNKLPYNVPNADDAAFSSTFSEVLKRSLYIYDSKVSADDKLLVLSTCCYNYVATYPNDFRFAIMARLVPQGEVLKDQAVLQQNPNPKAP